MLRRREMLTAAALALLTACAPANERPLSGARPGSQAPTPPGVPPTLAPSDTLRQRQLPTAQPAQPQPSPGLNPSPSVQPSPSVVAHAPPIVRTIVPGANSHVPSGGPITLSAVLVGRSADLVSASLSVNGADAGAQIDKRSPRDWTIHASQTLATGTHTVKVLVRDTSGASGGFTWQITAGEPTPAPAPTP